MTEGIDTPVSTFGAIHWLPPGLLRAPETLGIFELAQDAPGASRRAANAPIGFVVKLALAAGWAFFGRLQLRLCGYKPVLGTSFSSGLTLTFLNMPLIIPPAD